MPISKTFLKQQLAQFSKNDLTEMVLKLASKRTNYEYLLVNFLDKDGGELTLFDEAKDEILQLDAKEFKGRTPQHQATKRLNACIKRIGKFTMETKSKKLESDLVLLVLELQFANYSQLFGAHFSGYDFKVGILLKRLISIVSKKLHPDYLIDYQDKINEFLLKIHQTSNRIKTVSDLPEWI